MFLVQIDIITKIIEVSPVAAAMLLLVWMFLKAIEKRDVRIDGICKSCSENMKEVLSENNKQLEKITYIISAWNIQHPIKKDDHGN